LRFGHQTAGLHVNDGVGIPGACAAESLERQLHLELIAVVRLGSKVDLGTREDEALAAGMPSARRPAQLEARLLPPQDNTGLLQEGRIDRIVDVTERIAIAEANRESMRDEH